VVLSRHVSADAARGALREHEHRTRLDVVDDQAARTWELDAPRYQLIGGSENAV